MSTRRRRTLAAAAVIALPAVALSAAPAQAEETPDAYQALWDVAWNDHDLDGVSNAREAGLGTDPEHPDTDGDGLSDGHELRGVGTTRHRYLGPQGEVPARVIPTDPTRRDTDGDGLTDAEENFHYTDPANVDTDGDTLPDAQELTGTLGADGISYVTNPVHMDSDLDQVRDNEELRLGTNPRINPAPGRYVSRDHDLDNIPDSGEQYFGTYPGSPDEDGDGLLDGIEVLGYGNYDWYDGDPVFRAERTNAHFADTDSDGLEDGVEVSLGTNARSTDTDGDGLGDAQEGFYLVSGLGWSDAPLQILVDPLDPDQNRNGVLDGQEFSLDGLTRV